MRIANAIPTISYRGLAPLLAALALSGCVHTEKPQKGPSCPPRCEVTITVPSDPSEPPSVDIETLRVKAGSTVEFHVELATGVPQTVDLELRFQEEVFEDAKGTPTRSLPIQPGRNSFRTRPGAYRVCPPVGCKYDVVDRGPGQRPPLDPWMIIER